MITKETILSRLTEATSGTDKELYTERELDDFAKSRLGYIGEKDTDDFIVNEFLDFWWDTDKPCRRCSVCGKLMCEGYCLEAGAAYYCSDECLHTEFTDEEWSKECEEDEQSYWTQWY